MWTGPAFTSVPPRSSGGDFLGMGAIGERMYGGVFPGLNNAARHIRPYTAICWMIATLHKDAFSHGKTEIAELRRKTQLGIWKVQLLLNWVAKIDGLQGYPGIDRFEGDPQEVELRRETWPNIAISFWDTAWYKPSLLNGLRFLNEGRNEYRGTYSCTEAGNALAEAYDAAVRDLAPDLAQWLADPESLTCTRARLDALRPVLELTRPSARERTAFLQQYYSASLVQGAGGKERRKGLMLTLRALASLQAEGADQSVETIRHVMAAGITPGGEPIDLADLEVTRVEWGILQVRALQRLAMEKLLALVERYVLMAEQTGKPRRSLDIAEAIAAYLVHPKTGVLLPTVEQNYESVREAQGSFETAQAAGIVRGNMDIDLAYLKARLRGNVSADPRDWPEAARQAIWALIVCAAEADNLAPFKGARRLLRWDEGKQSLQELSAAVRKYMKESVETFARHVIHSSVIGQHTGVAIERSVVGLDGKDRFVFFEERHGLTRYADVSAARFVDPQESGDILYHALLLLENCGVLASEAPPAVPAYTHRFNASFRLNESGHRLLQGKL